jgi:glutaredoxin
MKKTPLTLLSVGVLVIVGAVHAQTLYRHVGPDGRVTFSDVPPPAGTARPAAAGPVAGAASTGSALPYELQQVASRYPVTLYTGEGCAPCGSGRALLNARGIPFTERTVSTADDLAALQRLSGDGSLPFLTIGGQQIKGYSDLEWTQFLDAAGYPKTSALPSTYRRPAPAPLVATRAPAAPAVAGDRAAARPAAPAEVPVTPPVNNPAGIRF